MNEMCRGARNVAVLWAVMPKAKNGNVIAKIKCSNGVQLLTCIPLLYLMVLYY